ncbi:aldehyde-activating protein [Thalassomonas actiniarum]|uniref:Aldehyde-activating protein n=1 Tax=Thalassomonas actiniarum TaxID=485447 RepID=A0AAF0C601_9GAMM|nr:aldehyde-activating protein [Thalassomonas actiniarum]WDE01681.1 aldehyde-activating protein [Thalassomonas actiniarum]
MNYSSTCSCGKVAIKISLPKNIEEYEPRACDCDFCMARSLSYLSDSNGQLKVYHSSELEPFKQGSEQASFWQCSSCHDLVVVTCEIDNHTKGAINARMFEKQYNLKPAVSVSPKTLAPEEKLNRWNTVWLKVEFCD